MIEFKEVRLKRQLRLVLFTAVSILVGFKPTAHGQVTMEVKPSLAPSTASSSWVGWRDNSLNALENGLTSVGDVYTDPAAYRFTTNLLIRENMLTSDFNSWHGIASPGGAFTAELGNRLTFGLHILGNGQQFKLSDLSFAMNSDDPGNSLQFIGNFVGFGYAAHRVGIDYVDGIKGNGNDIIYSAGQSGTNLIDELIYVGVGNAPEIFTSFPGATLQNKIDLAALTDPFFVTTVYTLSATGGPFEGSATVLLIPEPTALVMGTCGLIGFVAFYRRSRRNP
jgi:hypothetical protein